VITDEQVKEAVELHHRVTVQMRRKSAYSVPAAAQIAAALMHTNTLMRIRSLLERIEIALKTK